MASAIMKTSIVSILHSKRDTTRELIPFSKFHVHSRTCSTFSKILRIRSSTGNPITSSNKLTLEEKMEALKEFDESKVGVKGLLDSGLKMIPPIFICPPEPTSYNPNLSVPVIDIEGFDGSRRGEIVKEMSKAMEEWGLFQLVNHGIPINVIQNLLKGTKEFHEQPQEKKLGLYSRDNNKSTRLYATVDLFWTKTAQWKDTLSCSFEDDQFDSDGLPNFSRESIQDYRDRVTKLIKDVVSELLAEALGLSSQHLTSLGGFDSQRLICHYYPACPEPHLTQGAMKHTDPYFLTVVTQDHLGGLQVLKNDQWLDVPPIEGALVINGGDFLQLITNDKFQSAEHRVIAQKKGPRISTACFFKPGKRDGGKLYGPLEEILSEENPPKYRETSSYEYYYYFFKDGINRKTKPLESLLL